MTANETKDVNERSRKSSSITYEAWLRSKVENEKYWFHKIELAPDFITPGWSDPKVDKLPYCPEI